MQPLVCESLIKGLLAREPGLSPFTHSIVAHGLFALAALRPAILIGLPNLPLAHLQCTRTEEGLFIEGLLGLLDALAARIAAGSSSSEAMLAGRFTTLALGTGAGNLSEARAGSNLDPTCTPAAQLLVDIMQLIVDAVGQVCSAVVS